MGLPDSGVSAALEQVRDKLIMYHIDLIVHLQRSRTAELLAQRLSREPSATQLDAGRVPLSLEDRLREAQDLIDQELDDLAVVRSDLNHFNDLILQHVLVLRNIRNNFLRW
jgi:hypothetical protein